MTRLALITSALALNVLFAALTWWQNMEREDAGPFVAVVCTSWLGVALLGLLAWLSTRKKV